MREQVYEFRGDGARAARWQGPVKKGHIVGVQSIFEYGSRIGGSRFGRAKFEGLTRHQ